MDLAYTRKTHADHSVCVRMLAHGGVFYVHEVQRAQVEATAFAQTMRTMHDAQPGTMVWHGSGTEKGSAQFIQKLIPSFRLKNATADKFIRAQPVAAAWNAGKVLLPNPEKFKAPWLAPFLSIVQNFTGVDDPHDDDVDALASAHYACQRQRVSGSSVWGRGPIAPTRMA